VTSYSGKATGAKGKGFSAEIRVEGLEATIAALRALAPDVLKRLQKEIKNSVRHVAAAAATRGPSGHPLKYAVRSSMRGKKTGMRVIAADRDTSIFEFAGTKGLSRSGGPITPQGAAMVRWLDGFGKPGRFLWGAWDESKDDVEADIKRAMGEAEHELQDHLNAAGETF
jgi:hypothetical protein